jgi:hypothetical protein
LQILSQAIAPWCPEKSQTKLLSRGVSLGIFDCRNLPVYMPDARFLKISS